MSEIKPYYNNNGITIYLGNCVDILPQLGIVTLVVTDPPYGIGENSKKSSARGNVAHVTDYGEFNWDKKVSKEIIDMVISQSTNQIIFGGNYYANWLNPSSAWIVWHKNFIGSDFADCELAWTSFSCKTRYFKWQWDGMLQEDMKHKEKRLHPSQKPLPLIKWILSKYAQKDDLILDPFMGSGTVLRACLELGFMCIGIDIDERYCKIAINRLSQSVMDFNSIESTPDWF